MDIGISSFRFLFNLVVWKVGQWHGQISIHGVIYIVNRWIFTQLCERKWWKVCWLWSLTRLRVSWLLVGRWIKVSKRASKYLLIGFLFIEKWGFRIWCSEISPYIFLNRFSLPRFTLFDFVNPFLVFTLLMASKNSLNWIFDILSVKDLSVCFKTFEI